MDDNATDYTSQMANSTNAVQSSAILEGSRLVTFIFLATLVVFTAVGNIIVCLAICTTRQMRTCSNILIVNMALGDIFYSLSTLPLSMVLLCFRNNWPIGKIGNIVFDAVWFSFLVVSFLNVVAIASERYIAITRPFVYKRTVTKRRVIGICVCLWLYVALLNCALSSSLRKPDGVVYIFVIPPVTYYVVLIIHAALAFIFIPVFYARIFFIAKRQTLEIMKYHGKPTRQNFYREMKATWTTGLVICLFFLVWLPFLINQFVDFADIMKGVWDLNNSVMCYVTYCNGPVNIFVYSFWNREIRRAILKLLSPSWKNVSRVTSISISRPSHSLYNY